MTKAFTLAELLIALAILGVIATFTIPKVLLAQQNAQFDSIAKEAVGSVSGAYENLKIENSATADTTFADLTPYLNYVRLDTNATIDDVDGIAIRDCDTSGAWICLRMHNGAVISYHPSFNFGGTANTNAFYYYIDPDGKVSGNQSGAFYLYFDGSVKGAADMKPGTVSGWGAETVGSDPNWFSWN